MLRPRTFSTLASAALLVVSLSDRVAARSWIDCIDHNYDAVYTKSDDWVRGGINGNGACEGYAYNYPGHDSGSHAGEYAWKIDAKQIRDGSAPVCQYKQKDATYNEWRRPIHAKPGDKLFLGYMPNGHVVKQKDAAGTWGVYWSGVDGVELTKPSELTRDRLVDGQLNGFDDGNCGSSHTIDGAQTDRADDSKPCVGSFSIPANAKSGRYQMVWYWKTWKGKAQENAAAYSSCFDVIVDDSQDRDDTVATVSRCDVLDEEPTTSPTPSPVSRQSSHQPVTTTQPLPVPTTPAPTPTQTPAPTPSKPKAKIALTSSFAASPTSSPFSAPLAAVTYNGVGGSGMYGKVTAMQCPSSNTCTQSDFAVSGPIAPFDEDLSLNLRGPLHIDGISVFTSADANSWSQVSAFSKQSASSENMVFLNNKGDPLKSGVFDMCDGNSQSYATADGKTASSGSTPFNGELDDGIEINAMSTTNCAQSGTCGVTRGVAHEGWKGSNKIFMVKAKMPHAPSGGKDLPAIWLLNGQIVRTAQYGCNCRGLGDGGKWKGGCGEIDVAEVLTTDASSVTSTIYSFKGSRGTNEYAPRPVDDFVVFVVILTTEATTGSADLGMAQILVMKPEDVDMTTPPTREQVQQWLGYRNGPLVNFDI